MVKNSVGLCFRIVGLLFLVIGAFCSPGMPAYDYGEALTKSLLFFEAQRSGYLPSNQRVKWRGNSGLSDGKINGVDLVGGYYDAGDNVKFGLPMAFTITMTSWSIIEYGNQLSASGELQHAIDAVKWGTDYLIKAHPEPYVLYGEVGDGNTDHYCWQRPEDMTTSRAAYKIDSSHAGSDLAGETAAAMASASVVFRRYDPSYSAELLKHAKQVAGPELQYRINYGINAPGVGVLRPSKNFSGMSETRGLLFPCPGNLNRQNKHRSDLRLFEFADKYRGKYDDSITVARKYYGSVSGYADELLWAAAWLYKATNEQYYLDYLGYNGQAHGGTTWTMTEFGWDVKYAGVQTIIAQLLMAGKAGKHKPEFEKYQEKAEFFMCACLGKGINNVQKTPGGLIFKRRWNNMQYVTSASFLTTVYSDYLTSAGKSLNCPKGVLRPSELLSFAKSQVDYILGYNPRATSYMVGYGKNYPQRVHHRASSIVSYKVDPSFVSCRGGYATWFNRKVSDPNLLVGAIVGGPDAYDNFADQRENYEQTEPATYNNAPLVGVLARLHGGHSGYNQLLPVEIPALKLVPNYPNPAAKAVVDPAPAGSSINPIAITQKMTNSWTYNGKTYYRYSATITNKSPKSLKHLKLHISKLYGPLWGLTQSGDAYFLPPWINSLDADKSIEFVYIHSASAAVISVTSYTLV